MYVCMYYVCVYVCMYLCMCMYVFMFVCVYVCTYLCIYVRMYVYTYIRKQAFLCIYEGFTAILATYTITTYRPVRLPVGFINLCTDSSDSFEHSISIASKFSVREMCDTLLQYLLLRSEGRSVHSLLVDS
jgi:hypothetical protein